MDSVQSGIWQSDRVVARTSSEGFGPSARGAAPTERVRLSTPRGAAGSAEAPGASHAYSSSPRSRLRSLKRSWAILSRAPRGAWPKCCLHFVPRRCLITIFSSS
eukprot:5939132-Pyramimonas_sp.AAC.1